MTENSVRINEAMSISLIELNYRTSRSGGPGGQNVNKLETRVELTFDVRNSPSLSESQREMIVERLGGRIDNAGILHVSSQASRSQWENKKAVLRKFVLLLRSALKPRKKRISTRPTRASNEKRLKKKKIASEKKRSRGHMEI
ncbi:MAG TPA: alternative ribosome rescue aminoacyl-tRNA hydrolase ArfB [Candidatus Kryptonia bacterium]